MADFSLLSTMLIIGDFGKVLLIESCWTMCVDRAEEMTRGSVSGKMTQLEGLQTVKCDGDTISYDTSLSTFTSGHVSLIMMFHWNFVGWPIPDGDRGSGRKNFLVHSRGLLKNRAMGLETLQIWMILMLLSEEDKEDENK